jgi:hypothetical protein
MQPVINGVATFSQAIFSGFVGQCIMHFEARFHENLNPMASNQTSANIFIRVIATAMLIQRQLPAQILVGETAYSFTGWNIYICKYESKPKTKNNNTKQNSNETKAN